MLLCYGHCILPSSLAFRLLARTHARSPIPICSCLLAPAPQSPFLLGTHVCWCSICTGWYNEKSCTMYSISPGEKSPKNKRCYDFNSVVIVTPCRGNCTADLPQSHSSVFPSVSKWDLLRSRRTQKSDRLNGKKALRHNALCRTTDLGTHVCIESLHNTRCRCRVIAIIEQGQSQGCSTFTGVSSARHWW